MYPPGGTLHFTWLEEFSNSSNHFVELKKADLMPTDLEFSVMEKYMVVMKPLISITEAIGVEKWVTVSMLRPLLYKLRHIHCIF